MPRGVVGGEARRVLLEAPSFQEEPMPRGMPYPPELRERAVRMVAEIGEPGAVRRVAE